MPPGVHMVAVVDLGQWAARCLILNVVEVVG